jgi:hypothetical protein
MIRKLILALGAVAILGTTALAPTAASANWKGKHWHGPRLGIVVANPAFYADDCYMVEKTFFRHGRWHTRLVEVCN